MTEETSFTLDLVFEYLATNSRFAEKFKLRYFKEKKARTEALTGSPNSFSLRQLV